MARNIQSISGGKRGTLGAFLQGLIGAVFWVGVALFLPYWIAPDFAPGLAPFVPWLPVIFYALAVWSILQSARNLHRLVNAPPQHRHRAAQVGQAQQRQSRSQPGKAQPPARHAPTVQRMR